MTKFAVPFLAMLCLVPGVPAFAALLAGTLVAIFLGNPYLERTRAWSQRLLAWSVIGLGAGMNIGVIASVGSQGFVYTLIGILGALTLGWMLGRWLKSDEETSVLISVGTAICGGSAIAAVAPAIKARPQAISVALGTVFLLNAVALLVFPAVGRSLGLDERQFGLWSALAIHDTSSVVGSAMQFGQEALHIATTVKLARALWIVPVTLGIGALYRARKNSTASASAIKKPWFILGFLFAAALVSWVPGLQTAGIIVERVARQALVVTLFLIGCNLSLQTLKAVGLRPLALGLALWLLVATLTCIGVVTGVIS